MKVKVSCPSCGRVTELDASKIPPKPVTFGCPGCKTKVPVDGAKIHQAEAAPPEPAAPPAAPDQPVPPVQAAAPTGPPDEEFDLLEHLEIPEDAVLPSGLIISDDAAVSSQLQTELKPYQSTLRPCASAREARAIASVNLPDLVVLVTGTVGAPPIAAIEPLLDLEPGERRRTFFVVVADNVKTMDGNLAFFHGVDLFIAKTDVPRADRVLYSALEFRRTLCGPYLEAMAEIEGA